LVAKGRMGNGPRIVEGNRSAPGVSMVEISLDAPEPPLCGTVKILI
jgi:hypothetical protein